MLDLIRMRVVLGQPSNHCRHSCTTPARRPALWLPLAVHLWRPTQRPNGSDRTLCDLQTGPSEIFGGKPANLHKLCTTLTAVDVCVTCQSDAIQPPRPCLLSSGA